MKAQYQYNYEGFANILKEIGIDAGKLEFLSAGFSSCVFDTGNDQVIKVLNKDLIDKKCVFRPVSLCVLQPVCVYDDFLGMYEVGVFPKLRTSDVKQYHVNSLKCMLAKQGYDFMDDKFDNVGLSPKGVPYVIDTDALGVLHKYDKVIDSKLAYVLKWPESQWEIFESKVVQHFNADVTQAKGWTLAQGKLEEPLRLMACL
jgi:hypothetical protein